MSDIREHVEKRMAELFDKDTIESIIDKVLEKRIVVLVNMHLGAALGVQVKPEDDAGTADFVLTWNSPLKERVDSYVGEFFELYLEKKVEEVSSRLSSDESIIRIQHSLDTAIEAAFADSIGDLVNKNAMNVGTAKARDMMEEVLRRMTGLGKNRTKAVTKRAIPGK